MSRLYKKRPALIESIGTVNALALTSERTEEYALWASREADLRQQAGELSDLEEAAIAATSERRRMEYDDQSAKVGLR